MLPTVGLYLLETLHRNQAPIVEKTDTQSVNRKYFERKPKIVDRKSFDRKVAAIASKSMDDVSNGYSSLSTVFNFVDFAISQNDVSSENKVFVNLIHRVRHDVNEASRLRACSAVTAYCDSVPDREIWIDAILLDVKRALNDIGFYVENVRIKGDGDGGVVALKHQFEWALSHHQKLLTRQISLSMCHQSLMAVIKLMQQLEMGGGPGSYELEGTIPDFDQVPHQPWLQDEGGECILRSPYSRKKLRSSQRNLSLPSIMISESEGDELKVQSINDIAIELPGSIPEDLPSPDNWDLYAPPSKSHQSFVQSTPQKSLDQLQAQTIGDQDQDQESFVRTQSQSSFDQLRPRAFSDQTRLRASADQVRPRPSLEEYKSRASSEQINPLPQLVKKSVERNDSSASISKAAAISLLAKRYRPRPVNVPRRRSPTRHQSLPTEMRLPYLPAHSSLINELSQWVLPSSHEDDLSTETSDTPPTSVTSSPAVPSSPASCPDIFRPVFPAVSIPMTSTPSTPVVLTNVLPTQNVSSPLEYSAQSPSASRPSESHSMSSQPKFVVATLSSLPNLQAQKNPPSIRRSQWTIPRRRMPITVGDQGQKRTEFKETSVISHQAQPSYLTVVTRTNPDSDKPKPGTPTGSKSIHDNESFASKTPNNHSSVANTPAVDSINANTSAISNPSTTIPTVNGATAIIPAVKPLDMPSPEHTSPTMSVVIPSTLTANEPTASEPRPMIAQSKRRAAHARRMRLAYGSEQ